MQLNSSVATWQVLYNKIWVEVICLPYPCDMTPVIVPERKYSFQIHSWIKIMWVRATPESWCTWRWEGKISFCCEHSFGDHHQMIVLLLYYYLFSILSFPIPAATLQIFLKFSGPTDVIASPEPESETLTCLWIVCLCLWCHETGMENWEE